MVTKEAAIEAEAEKDLDGNLSSPLDTAEGFLAQTQSIPRRTSEEVFLAQLHRRSLLLNDGFQSQILQVLSRYETDKSIRRNDSWSQSNMSGSTMRFSADLILSSSSMSDSFTRKGSATTISDRSWRTMDAVVVPLQCIFNDGAGTVEVHQAPIKTWVCA